MTKYKYTRKELVKKWSVLADAKKDLLATIPEEETNFEKIYLSKNDKEVEKEIMFNEEDKECEFKTPCGECIFVEGNCPKTNKCITPTPSPIEEISGRMKVDMDWDFKDKINELVKAVNNLSNK
jgi:hypothetical protein